MRSTRERLPVPSSSSHSSSGAVTQVLASTDRTVSKVELSVVKAYRPLRDARHV
jgi:hypothetical protein